MTVGEKAKLCSSLFVSAQGVCGGVLSRVKVKVLVSQSCVILCDPMGGGPPGFSVQGFFRQEYWNGLPFPSARDLPDAPAQCSWSV